uniref:Uncharacterized protein n=1 Tax=Rhizochromulina marina TaxID=1034831 RepID=A0A7S2W137_9STRA|mmetsp:Transcript_10752/g.30851  ORF Transcript_10752/g.30851 Transcript_10752/m.30851 type:complete len:105 (+) Transcript_10752:351-665(+)
MAESMLEQLDDVVARVPDPVFLVVCTKAELLTPEWRDAVLQHLTRRLEDWEERRCKFAAEHFKVASPAEASGGGGGGNIPRLHSGHRTGPEVTETPVPRQTSSQ